MRPNYLGRAYSPCRDCGEPCIGWHWDAPALCVPCAHRRNERELAVVYVLATLGACLLAFALFARGAGL